MMRLSKRMAHLDLCSRREADRLISQGMVLVRGEKIEPILGQKVDSDEMDISIVGQEHIGFAVMVILVNCYLLQ